MIYNMFNKDLLTRYNKLQFKGQYVEPILPPTMINEKEEYEVEEVHKHRKQGRETQYLCYKLKILELIKKKNLVLELIQENLIENSVQNSLPYILNLHSLCQLLLTYPKQLCISLKINICYIYCIISSFQNLLRPSINHITYDYYCDLLSDVTDV